MELSVRDWMIIIGVLLIVAVLLDGYRRVRSERRNRIRVTLSKQAMQRGILSQEEPPAPAASPGSPNPELPNGGARIIGERRRQDLNLDETVPVLMESVHIAPLADEDVCGDPAPEAAREPEAGQRDDVDPAPAEVGLEPEPEPELEPEPEPPLELPEATAGHDADREQADVSYGAPAHDSPRPAGTQEVLLINVLSRDPAGFKGQDVLQILLACDLRFGNMNIFHRHEKAGGKGAVQFSVANLVEPGTFDLDRIDHFTTPGLCLFLTMPGPEKPITAFNYMVETAQVLVKNLHGELRDEAHSVMTPQTIEHCRQRIRDFERKQLTLHL